MKERYGCTREDTPEIHIVVVDVIEGDDIVAHASLPDFSIFLISITEKDDT